MAQASGAPDEAGSGETTIDETAFSRPSTPLRVDFSTWLAERERR